MHTQNFYQLQDLTKKSWWFDWLNQSSCFIDSHISPVVKQQDIKVICSCCPCFVEVLKLLLYSGLFLSLLLGVYITCMCDMEFITYIYVSVTVLLHVFTTQIYYM